MSNKLTTDEMVDIEQKVRTYLQENQFITNRVLRQVTSVNYDQAIFFFNQMIEKGVLQRTGVASGTRYVLA